MRRSATLILARALLLATVLIGAAPTTGAQDQTPTAGSPDDGLPEGVTVEPLGGTLTNVEGADYELHLFRIVLAQPGNGFDPHPHEGATVMNIERGTLVFTVAAGEAQLVRATDIGDGCYASPETAANPPPGTPIGCTLELDRPYALGPGDRVSQAAATTHAYEAGEPTARRFLTTAAQAGSGTSILVSELVKRDPNQPRGRRLSADGCTGRCGCGTGMGAHAAHRG